MTTFEVSKSELEVKAWKAWDDSQVLDSMGYDSYQEYLDDMAYNEMMNPLCD